MSSHSLPRYRRHKFEEFQTRFSHIKATVFLKHKQIDKAVTQVDLLTNKIEGVCARYRVAIYQQNEIFKNSLNIELQTLERIRSVYNRFIVLREDDLEELDIQLFDLANEMQAERIQKQKSENNESEIGEHGCYENEIDEDDSYEYEFDESDIDEYENEESESDESESEESASDESESEDFDCGSLWPDRAD